MALKCQDELENERKKKYLRLKMNEHEDRVKVKNQ
jgi:hypothetical protein